MKVNNFQKAEKSILSDFFESEEYKYVRELMNKMKAEWKEQAIAVTKIEDLRYFRGKIEALDNLDELLRKNHKKNLPSS